MFDPCRLQYVDNKIVQLRFLYLSDISNLEHFKSNDVFKPNKALEI